jgi:PAS domain S-box-containing protein/putative nucleotidyltransferase with HDIG domain
MITIRSVLISSREAYHLVFILIVAFLMALFSVSINLLDNLYWFFKDYAYFPLIEFLVHTIFLTLCGMMWLTYRRWRRAERKRAELENMIDSISSDVIMVVDRDDRVVRSNASLKRIFGYQPDEILGRRTEQLFRASPDPAGDIPSAPGEIRTGGFAVTMATGRFKDGHEIPLEVVTGKLTTGQGAVLLLRDISERVAAEAQLRNSYRKLQELLEETVNILAMAVEMRDPYTAGHQRRVAALACAIADELGLSSRRRDGLRLASIVHDVGKLYVPAEILSKPGVLTEMEFNLIKSHSQLGYDLLKKIDFPWPVAEMVLQHHERIDGSGYPQGLRGKEILLESRIMGVADVVEAMASHRPYREAHGTSKALEEISAGRGKRYDSAAVDACLKLFYEHGFEFEMVPEVEMMAGILEGR